VGERHSRAIAEKNEVKRIAYGTAYESMVSLQQELTALAEEGNQEIEAIENSKLPAPAKAAEIARLIFQYQALACVLSAKYSGNIIDAMQRILDAEGANIQARQFAQAHGADLSGMFRRSCDQQELTNRVQGMLGDIVPPEVLPTGKLPAEASPTSTEAAEQPELGLQSVGMLPTSPHPVAAGCRSTTPSAMSEVLQTGRAPTGYVRREPVVNSSTTLPSAPAPLAPGSPSPPVSPMSSPLQPMTGAHSALPEPSLAALPPTPTISPTELAQSFNKGMESGAPLSAAAHAVPSVPMTSTEPQISHAAQTIPSAAPSPQVHIPVADSPPPVHHAPAAEVAPATPTPIVAAPQVISTPVTPQAVGPLPTYGSDVRPPVSTITSPPATPSTPLTPPASPSSAPVTPSAGHSAAHQPAVVRRTTPPTPPPPPTTFATQAVAATATGAALGGASAETTARKRLQRLVTAVARQQPRLAWAAGDHPDNTTLLVTDLASGWIPPGIDLPSALTLLPPARRRGTLEALLGGAIATASYTPIHHLTDDAEPVPTSSRPRSAPTVGDLGWELSQATKWRDGLPRLAHTLAKAASAGTGVLDSELDLLREHLANTSKRVLDSYPHDVDTHQVGNWQLLAAIDALVAGDTAAANYHLAWFLTARQ
jgi:hypothetical protein